MPAPIEVRKIPLHNVSDASELAKLIDDGVMDADRVVAVIGKTEGNGGVNDYTRIIADRAFREVLLAKGSRSEAEVKQIPIVWSGGTDGVISPHATVFATLPEDAVEKTDEPRLTVGFAMSETLLPEDIGRLTMVEKVAEASEPHRLCTFLFDLAQAFTAFYESCPVLTAEDPAVRESRIALSALTLRVLLQGLDLLGIEVPERM